MSDLPLNLYNKVYMTLLDHLYLWHVFGLYSIIYLHFIYVGMPDMCIL